MPVLHVDNLSLGYGEAKVIDALKLDIPAGKITALVGPNGCGKSTILKGMARLLRPMSGLVLLDGKAIHKQSTKRVAQQLAILPQGPEAPDGSTVEELVSYGRFPYQKGFGSRTKEDQRMIAWSLSVTGMGSLTARAVDSLSGGQRQRAWIAMALAQGTHLLLLDEPTTFLDMAHQLEVLKLLQKLNREEGRTIVMVVHDLNHASRFAHHMVAIQEGKVVSLGSPPEVMRTDVLRQVFGIEAEIIPDPRSGVPLCLAYELVNVTPLDRKVEVVDR